MTKNLKIAQVAPLYESVPPRLYGGTERVVSYLTEGLARAGHDVTLFASGDSHTSAKLMPWGESSIRLDEFFREPVAAHMGMLDLLQSMQDEFDIIHFHCEFFHFPLLRHLRPSCLTTLHGRLDLKEVQSLYRRFPEASLVSISHNQRRPLPEAMWLGNVYHGLPENMYRPNFQKGEYLAFLGRISPEKGVGRAIEIAKRCGVKLKIAAKIDEDDLQYFREEIAPLLDHPLVEFVGEIGESQKSEFLGGAKALLFPISWPEPFGMVMIEAMACACPVMAFGHGSVTEIVEEGASGIIVHSVDEAVRNFNRVLPLDRRDVRRSFERRFGQEAMTENYLKLYFKLLIDKAPEMDNERNFSMFL